MLRYARLTWLVGLTLVMHLCGLTTALCAQDYGQPEKLEKSYVPCYIVIIMAVVLGLTVICRMGKRSSDIRRPM